MLARFLLQSVRWASDGTNGILIDFTNPRDGRVPTVLSGTIHRPLAETRHELRIMSHVSEGGQRILSQQIEDLLRGS